MILYHGSNMLIERIDLTKSRPNKDFGRAFYLSKERSQAEQMAEFKAMSEGGTPLVSAFKFDDSLMSNDELKVLSFDEYSEEWAKFVFSNRDQAIDLHAHEYDIVYGPIANDKVGRQILNLKEGYITFEMFLERLKFMKGITFQYAFCTQRAIDKLVRI